MASYNELIALIDAFIKRNGVQAITGQILNGVLKAMVDQVGRGYAIMGVATPSTNPGTPDAPESWFASTPGTYTNFGGLEVADAEFALLSYTPSGEVWTKTTLTEGIQEVSASIDGNVGTPEVTAEYINGGLIFTFSNMKGQTGDAAGFGTVNATVDGNIGTPGVSVNTSGPDTAKNITFAFRNLKGETGVTSVVATVDNTSGTPSCAVSLVGQELHLDFHGLKGAQGDTGSSVDYPFTIVNNLTTDDPTQALSAAQGVVLQGELSQLEAKVTPIEAATDLLGWEFTYTFDKTKPSSALLNNPIVLSQEGDSLEVYVTDVPSTQNMNAGGYAFAGKNGSTRGNIALSYAGSVWVRADNDSWILQYGNGATGSTRRVKIVYNSASIDFYVDGTKVSTYNSLTPITIYTFGNANNSSNYGYWSGKIKELKVNGVDVYLSSIATLTNVVVEGNHSFLSPSDLEDSLESTSTSKALTANQGKVLKGLIDDAEEDITALEGSVTGIEETAFGEVDETTTTNIDEVPGVVKMAGYNAGPNGATEVLFSALSGYDSYYFYPSSALSAWLTDPGVSYIAISIVENAQPFSINAIQGTSAYRKRKSEGNLPTESSPLSIPEGSAVIVTVSSGAVVGFSNKIKKTTFNGETPLAQEHIEQVLNEIEENGGGEEMYVSKTATQLNVFLRLPNGKYIRYPFVKRYKAFTTGEYPSFYDNWGIDVPALAEYSGTMADVAPLFLSGDAELAVSVPSGSDGETPTYVGGQAHGFENIVTGSNGREICILVDNQKVAEDAVLSLTPASKVDIIQHTKICQAYTNTNPFADVTKHWVWENGKMSCTTSVKVLRSIFFRYSQFGMLCVYRRWLGDVNNDYLTNSAIKNSDPYKVFDVSDGWSNVQLQAPDKDCTRIVEYGQKGLGFSMSIKTETMQDNGGMFVATNNAAYNKIYFDMGRSFTPSVNDVLEGTQTWEILG